MKVGACLRKVCSFVMNDERQVSRDPGVYGLFDCLVHTGVARIVLNRLGHQKQAQASTVMLSYMCMIHTEGKLGK